MHLLIFKAEDSWRSPLNIHISSSPVSIPRQQQLFLHQMAIRSIKQHASASGVERERARSLAVAKHVR